ncbi:MAG: hypothetical protein MRERV_22c033 [Mycoplasmataceae bacterium RV_VA103A]|nr:MAG: hypothetical protein MRERV_22c033 [Mycoplasmataceae bacterium RV_VA103A]
MMRSMELVGSSDMLPPNGRIKTKIRVKTHLFPTK